MRGNALKFVEVVPVQDVWATGIARVEQMGAVERITLYSTQISADGRETEHVIVARIIAPAGALRMPGRDGQH